MLRPLGLVVKAGIDAAGRITLLDIAFACEEELNFLGLVALSTAAEVGRKLYGSPDANRWSMKGRDDGDDRIWIWFR